MATGGPNGPSVYLRGSLRPPVNGGPWPHATDEGNPMGGGSAMGVFVPATLLLLAVPGPSVLYAVARTVAAGRSAGLLSVVGLEAGLLVHVLAATLGLSALVASSPGTLTTLRYAGAGYLLLLAGRQLGSGPWWPSGRRQAPRVAPAAPALALSGRWLLVRDGFVVEVLNPKTGLFFLAFLPQFVAPGRAAGGQLLVLGGFVVALACLCDSTYVVVSAHLARRHRGAGRWGSAPSRGVLRVTSGVYVGLAAFAALG